MNEYRTYRIMQEIGTGGSDRKFYRLVKNGKTYILIQGKHMSEYRTIRKHLARCGIAVPRLYVSYRDTAIVEDLGDHTLFELTTKKGGIDLNHYRRVLKELVKLQVGCVRNLPLKRHYDADHIRWEQDYFREFFLGQFSRFKRCELTLLDRDFQILTRDVIFWTAPVAGYFMHRDFQSQNIIFKKNRPFFIDFQSARIGPLTYDLASLLKDAYVPIGGTAEKSLLNYYFDELKYEGLCPEKKSFLKAYHLSGIQRNMQALGAFANLSLNKGKPRFRAYIPRAVNLLRFALQFSPYPQLRRIIGKLPYA
jgi:aminoglycoside/choline kinase family phosphotransferase